MTLALTLYVLFLLCGLASLISGVYLLAGLGFALLAGGAAFLILAFFIAQGMRDLKLRTIEKKA